ncbi:hypothetical protein B1B04_06140 [Lysinibacillus sp. KCTC 33748]|nr:hypothetical protein B1B04_06140 [Lysinibacillus sp. KCTC 33748]
MVDALHRKVSSLERESEGHNDHKVSLSDFYSLYNKRHLEQNYSRCLRSSQKDAILLFHFNFS